jgi:P-type Cu+ transporter
MHHGEEEMNVAEAGQGVRDPVCGMLVDPASSIRHEHEARTYYFCSSHCREKFRGAPADYTREERPYICPVHPEIHQRAPGRCPNCGEALQRVAA